MRHAVILAGGSGTRLWPASRRGRPKQLLALTHDKESLLATAVSRARAIADDRVVVVTSEALAAATQAAVPDVELIAEPAARNTAAAIGLAAAMILERDPSAVIAVLPADQHVRDREGLTCALDTCLTAVERTDVIALVGIPPTRAETGFGYLEMAAGPSDGVRAVLRFVEKPDQTTAYCYLASGRYLWNAGIFCLTARRLLAELDTHLPQTAGAVRQIVRDNGLVLDPRGLYEALPAVSFDTGVMEKTDRVVAVPAAVGWNDVGSWAALPEVCGHDDDGNTILGGDAIVLDGSRNIVVTDDGTMITMVGISDLVVVKAGGAILVVRRDQAQRVREVVDALGARGFARLL